MFSVLIAASLAAASASAPAPSGIAAAPAVSYRSAFDDYRTWDAQSPRDWREVNDEVERLGGHAGHLRGSTTTPDSQRLPPAGTAPQPAAAQDRSHDSSRSPEPRQ